MVDEIAFLAAGQSWGTNRQAARVRRLRLDDHVAGPRDELAAVRLPIIWFSYLLTLAIVSRFFDSTPREIDPADSGFGHAQGRPRGS
jgi:hypothetical protein